MTVQAMGYPRRPKHVESAFRLYLLRPLLWGGLWGLAAGIGIAWIAFALTAPGSWTRAIPFLFPTFATIFSHFTDLKLGDAYVDDISRALSIARNTQAPTVRAQADVDKIVGELDNMLAGAFAEMRTRAVLGSMAGVLGMAGAGIAVAYPQDDEVVLMIFLLAMVLLGSSVRLIWRNPEAMQKAREMREFAESMLDHRNRDPKK